MPAAPNHQERLSNSSFETGVYMLRGLKDRNWCRSFGYRSCPERECRLCLGRGGDNLIAPCNCSGSSRWVHQTCLDQWRSSNCNPRAFSHCCSCGFRYRLQDVQVSSLPEKQKRPSALANTWPHIVVCFLACVLALRSELDLVTTAVVMGILQLIALKCKGMLGRCKVPQAQRPVESSQMETELTKYVRRYAVVEPHEENEQSSKMAADYAVALHDFEPSMLHLGDAKLLGFATGQLLQVDSESSGWLCGHLLALPGNPGFFPKSYVIPFAQFCEMQQLYYSRCSKCQ